MNSPDKDKCWDACGTSSYNAALVIL